LAGIGRVSGESLLIDQVFLEDFPGEPVFLEVLTGLLADVDLLCSYNGRAFDRHILMTRFIMNGRTPALPAEVDLLYLSRRLYRSRLQACGLSDLEAGPLGVHRALDVPSMEIPDRFFSFARTRDWEMMRPVFAHHAEDIRSLAKLFDHLGDIVHEPESARGVDRFQLARTLLEAGRTEGVSMLEAVVEGEAAAYDADEYRRCAQYLGFCYKRQGRFERARRVWELLHNAGASYVGAVELAKHYEHRDRNPRAALGVLAELREKQLPERARRELRRRRERLVKKCESLSERG
jgi:hypothetical protein